MVYIRLIEEVLREGRQVIVLIPEIALTYQNVGRFCGYFGDRVAVMNSRMTPAQRYEQMERAASGQVSIMLAPLGAVRAVSRSRLIIIDEEHETSYKSEVTPRYHARETAIERARLEHAHVVMGSATPSVDAYYRCRTGAYALFVLEGRYGRFQASRRMYCGYAGRIKEREPFHYKRGTGRADGAVSGTEGAGDAVSEPERVCRLYFLPFLRICGKMSPLRRIADRSQ